MFAVTLNLDGVSISIRVGGKYVVIKFNDNETFYFSTTNASLIASAIFAAVNEVETEA